MSVGNARRTLPRRIPLALSTPCRVSNVTDTPAPRFWEAPLTCGAATVDLHATTGVVIFFVALARGEIAVPTRDAPMCVTRAVILVRCSSRCFYFDGEVRPDSSGGISARVDLS